MTIEEMMEDAAREAAKAARAEVIAEVIAEMDRKFAESQRKSAVQLKQRGFSTEDIAEILGLPKEEIEKL